MDVSFLGGPHPQRGVGVVAPFDFALDRELWRWVPDEVSLHLTRTPFVPVEVSLDLARLVSEHETLREAVRALCAVAPEVVAYACTSGSFVGGVAGERGMCAAMEQAGEMPALTTSGALLEALHEIDAKRIALVTPYTRSVTSSLEEYLAEGGISVTGRAYLGLTRHIWKVPYRDVVDMARQAVVGAADALFISCTNLPTYDVIPQLEAELRMPVLSANQVTMWAALQRIGAEAVGPYQALLDPVARRGPAAMSSSSPTVGRPFGDEQGYTEYTPGGADGTDHAGAGDEAAVPGTGVPDLADVSGLADVPGLGEVSGLSDVPGLTDVAGLDVTDLSDVPNLPDVHNLTDGQGVGETGLPGLGGDGGLGGERTGPEPEAAFAGSPGLPEADAVDGLDPPPYPEEPGGPAPGV